MGQCQTRSRRVDLKDQGYTLVEETRNEIYAALRRNAIFKEQNILPDDILSVIDGMKVHEYVDGEVICRHGDSSTEFYVLQIGVIRAYDADGNIAGEIRAIEMFGEYGMFVGVPRTSTLTASAGCIIHTIDIDEYYRRTVASYLRKMQIVSKLATVDIGALVPYVAVKVYEDGKRDLHSIG